MSNIRHAGTPGIDHSANAAAVPLAGYTLIQTIAVWTRRNKVEVQNQSAGMIQVVLDDNAGGTPTSILLAGGGAANTQGAGWSDLTFKGRVRIYAATSGAQVAAYET